MLNQVSKERHVCPVIVESRYETGVPEWILSNGLRFKQFSWLLCETSLRPTNVIHYQMVTRFRFTGPQMNGLQDAGHITVTRWNPTYDGDEHKEDVVLKHYHVWRPIMVVWEGSHEPVKPIGQQMVDSLEQFAEDLKAGTLSKYKITRVKREDVE